MKNNFNNTRFLQPCLVCLSWFYININIIGLRLSFKPYQFIVRNKCERVPFSILLIQDQLTSHFFGSTSLRDHNKWSGNETYSTMEGGSISAHYVEAYVGPELCGLLAPTLTTTSNLQPQAGKFQV